MSLVDPSELGEMLLEPGNYFHSPDDDDDHPENDDHDGNDDEEERP